MGFVGLGGALSLRTVVTLANQQFMAAMNQMEARTAGFVAAFRASTLGLTAGGAAIGLALGVSAKQAANFEQAMANMNSVARVSGAEFQQLSGLAKEMGRTTRVGATDAANALYELASAGQRTGQMMNTLPGIIQLATATQYDMSEVTQTVVASLNQFNLDASETDRIVNSWAATIGNTLGKMDKIQESYRYLGNVAYEAGFSIEATNAALGVMYNAGLQGSQAGTALRRVLAALLNPTESLKARFAALKIPLEELDPRTHKLSEIMVTLRKSGMDAGKAFQDFGLRGAGALLALMRNAEYLDELEAKITGTSDAALMAEMQMDTLSGQMTLLRNKFQVAAIELGTAMLPVLRDVVEWLSRFAEAASKMSEGTAILAAKLSVLTGGMVLTLATIAKMAPLLGALTGPLGLITLAVGGAAIAYVAWNAHIEENYAKLQRSSSAHEATSTRVETLTKRYKELREQVDPLTTEQMAELKEVTAELIRTVPTLSGLTTDQAQAFSDTAEKAQEHADSLHNIAVEEAKQLLAQRERLQAMTENPEAWGAMEGFAENVGYAAVQLEAVNKAIAGLDTSILAEASGLKFPNLPADWDEHNLETVGAGFQKIGEEADTVVVAMTNLNNVHPLDTIKDFADRAAQSFQSLMAQYQQFLAMVRGTDEDETEMEKKKRQAEAMGRALTDVASNIGSVFAAELEQTQKFWKSLLNGLRSGLIQMIRMVVQAAIQRILIKRAETAGLLTMEGFLNWSKWLEIGPALAAGAAAMMAVSALGNLKFHAGGIPWGMNAEAPAIIRPRREAVVDLPTAQRGGYGHTMMPALAGAGIGNVDINITVNRAEVASNDDWTRLGEELGREFIEAISRR